MNRVSAEWFAVCIIATYEMFGYLCAHIVYQIYK